MLLLAASEEIPVAVWLIVGSAVIGFGGLCCYLFYDGVRTFFRR